MSNECFSERVWFMVQHAEACLWRATWCTLNTHSSCTLKHDRVGGVRGKAGEGGAPRAEAASAA